MLAADYLYSLTARAGVPDDGFGFSHAANDQFHVVANFASHETYHFLTEAPDYESFFYGEIQIHDAATGDLLRTIQNPLPYGMGGFGSYGESNFQLVAPNSFGYSIDIHENLILVGSPGWDSNFAIGHNDPDFETGGKAFLFDAITGDLLHTFDGSFEPVGTQGRNNDGFGRSVSIDGNRIAIGAPGPSYEDSESQIWDTDSGHAYVYSATTGNLISMVESPYLDPTDTMNFGATVSLSGGKLVVTEPGDLQFSDSGPLPSQVYDAETGDLLLALGVDGSEAVIEGNNIAILEAPGTTHLVNATSGAVTQTFSGRLYDFDSGLIVSGPASGDNTAFPDIRDSPLGNILYSVPTPPNFVETYFEYNQIPQVFEDRLLVPGRRGPAIENVVFVYSVTNAEVNLPPTDIELSNDSVAENVSNATIVGALSATDPTPGDTLTFNLVSSAGGRFGIDGTNLVVANGSLLNFEAFTSHSITVRVTDSVGNTYDEAFTINVTDVNEAATVITLSPSSKSENTSDNALVGTLSTDDPDASDPQTFVLLDNAGGRFMLVGSQIRVADASLLDFETASSHQINVRVTDSASHVLEQLVTISITDFNYTPSDIGLSGNQIREGSVRVLTNPASNRPNGFGTQLAASDTRLVVADRDGVAPEDYVGRVHVYDAVSNALLTTLSNPGGLPGDRFGQSIATAGNYIVVGAGGEDVIGQDAGRAYIFDATNGALLHVLWNPDQTAGSVNDEFGAHVSIFGSTVAVSTSADATAANAGAVHLFDAVSGNLLTTILSPEPAESGFFGISISMTSNRLLIGAGGNSATGIFSGRAYLFNYDSVTGSTSLATTIDNPTPGDFDVFGTLTVMTPTVLAIAVPNDDAIAGSSGVVHLFNASTGVLLQTIPNPTPAANDLFGESLAVAGDYIIVGARDDSGGDASGQVYVFSAVTGAFLAAVENPTPAANDDFGRRVTANSMHIVTSAFGDDSDVTDSGRVYVLDLPFGESIGTLSATDPEPNETFTFSLIDDANGRFAVQGNQLVVADATLLDFESAASHDIIVQVMDAGGATRQETFTINVTDVLELYTTLTGTSGDDAYTLTYSAFSVGNTGTVTVTVATNGGLPTTVGTFPMSNELTIHGLAGIDSVQVVGTSSPDHFALRSPRWVTNGASLYMTSIETRGIDGGAGNDVYFFDADEPLGLISLNDASGVDRIDFDAQNFGATPTAAGIAVNLSLTASQIVHPTNLSLILQPANAFENLYGGIGNDTLTGNTVANTIIGGAGNDTITGAGGNDSLYGGMGDDEFLFNAVTSAEVDYIAEYFNQGTDRVSFASMPINVAMNLGTVAAQTVHVGRTLSLSSAVTVEIVVGGAGNDHLLGNTLGNTLIGNAGNDTLTGFGGSDTMEGGPGFDSYSFTSATSLENDVIIEADNLPGDTISFSTLSIGVTLDLSSTAVQPIHTNRTLQLSGSNAIESVMGGSGDDVLSGNAAINGMTGGAGNDVLNGRGGNDSLYGQTGNDTYVFSPAAASETDFIQEAPGEGADTINFGLLTTTVTVDLSTAAAQLVHLNRFLFISSGQTIENIVGGSGTDILTGNTLANTITGGPGNDTITGAGGNDSLYGGDGDDEFVFNAVTSAEADYIAEYFNQGFDTISFASMSISVATNLGSVAVQTVHVGRTLLLSSAITVENVVGGSNNDTLTGNTLANTLTGNGGGDYLRGVAGDDTLIGGPGDDQYVFATPTELENDAVVELNNEGNDILAFTLVTASITLDLSSTLVQPVHLNRTLQLSSGSTFETVFCAAGDFPDTLTGNSLANYLASGGGNDTLIGGGGSDVLDGGTGNDIYVFGIPAAVENDEVSEWGNAGSGTDRLDFTAITSAVSLNLGSVAVQSIHLNRTLKLSSAITVENVTVGSGNNTIIGNSLANHIIGGGAHDVLLGGDGDDVLEGGSGRDILIGGSGADSLFGGISDDIVVAGIYPDSANLSAQLNDLRSHWTSAATYLTRITDLRAGVGATGASLAVGSSVLDDISPGDELTGGDGDDWFIAALDDLVTDQLFEEVLDLL